jgi:hypothetical protein
MWAFGPANPLHLRDFLCIIKSFERSSGTKHLGGLDPCASQNERHKSLANSIRDRDRGSLSGAHGSPQAMLTTETRAVSGLTSYRAAANGSGETPGTLLAITLDAHPEVRVPVGAVETSSMRPSWVEGFLMEQSPRSSVHTGDRPYFTGPKRRASGFTEGILTTRRQEGEPSHV